MILMIPTPDAPHDGYKRFRVPLSMMTKYHDTQQMIQMQSILAIRCYLPKWNTICVCTYELSPMIIAKVQKDEVVETHNLF